MHWLRSVRPRHLVARRSGSRKATRSRDRRRNSTVPRRQPAHPRMVKPSGPRRSAPEVELCIPVIDEESTKGRRISMMITMHLLMDAPKSTLGPIGRLGDDLHDAHQAMASNMLGFIRNHCA